MGFLLFVLAFVLTVLFAPVGLVFTTIKSILKNDKKYISKYYRKLAIAIDRLGNVVMAEFFNAILITEEGHKFGDGRETISSVLGKNSRTATFKLLGYCLNEILNKIDHNHTIKNIEE